MKKLIIYTGMLALLAGLSGCKKFLDLKPRDGIVREDYWKTKEQVNAAVAGIYASMLGSTSGDRALPEYMFIWGECRGDMVTPGFRATQEELDIANMNMVATNSFTNWRAFYQTINYCNTVIQLAPAVLTIDNTFSQDMLDKATGQAMSLRALMYFYLIRSFKSIPLKLTATLSDNDIANIPQVGADTVYAQILTDLKKADSLLPSTYGSKDADKGHVTKFANNALLADVYLWLENYTACAAECDKVINSNKFGLIPGPNFYTQVFLDGNSNESIFELQYGLQKVNPFWGMFTPANRRWGAAFHLTEQVYGLDLLNATPQVDYRGDNSSYRNNDFSIWKYVGADNTGGAFRAADQSVANWIFYRYADILLMKAEAINQLDQPLEASRIVKTIRKRANAIELNPMDSTQKSGMTKYILEERQREFAFEGKRWYDVLRNAKRRNYENLNFLITMAGISIPSERQQAAFNKLRDFNSHYFPIYFYELQTNKLLVQNSFYK